MLEDILGCADRCNIGLCSSVGPVREGMKFKHGIPPGVDAQVDGQNSNDVQHEAGLHLKGQTHRA